MNQMKGNKKHRSIILPAVLLIMLQIGSLLISSCYGCLESERTALLHVKDSLNHPKGSALPSWGKQANCCQWDGVDCHTTTSRVLRLSLNYVRDTRLPSWHLNCSLFLPFQDLQELYLLGNSIAGCVENEGFNKLLTLQNLRVLDLSRNRFVDHRAILSLKGISSLTSLGLGAFWDPDQEVDYRSFEILRKLKDLEFLDLSYNHMDNRILSYLVSLSTLKTLHLDGNNLQETIHIQGDHGHELLKLSNLEVLDLGTNNLSSNVFSSLFGLLSLKILYLDENALSGTFVTAELSPLHNLEELYLMGTYIEQFTAAKETTTLSKLKLVDISSNNRRVDLLQLNKAFQLVKSLKLQYNRIEHATAIEGFKNLEELYLDGSVLDENFLPSVGVSNSIKDLSLKGCNLNGSLPSKGWCELNTLQQLNLGGNNLHGNLPSCLRNLTSLGALDISDNLFTGDIAATPLSNLPLLEFLSISNNNFHIPMSISPFMNNSKLKVLINSNKLIPDSTFQTPPQAFQLHVFRCTYMSLKRLPQFLYSQTSLRVLDLSYNNLTGMFPSWLLTNNSRLNKLSFRSNSFIGPLRLPSLHNPNLFLLDTTGNHLGGKIPQSFGLVFPNLQFLIMDENSFEGEIPPSFGKMRSLKYLSLSNNALVGNIPSDFGELTSLLLLDLSNNKLSGEVTKELVFGCSQLQILKLSNNNLEGEIFPLLYGLTNFEFFYVLYLDGNKFKGEILDFAPTSPFSMLNRLDLSNNNISGQLPRWIGNFWSLELLVMSNNYFDGPIPVEFCDLINLVYFDLSLNNLSGSIPSCFNLSSIKHVILSQNKLVGNITYAFQGSSSLVMLDLSNNHLSGTIPTQISSFSALSVVSLKGNHFEGKIPLQLCQLNKLSMVDLSHKNLSGTIVHCLGNLTLETLEEKSIVGKGTLDYSDWFNTRLDTRKRSPSLDDGMMDIYNFQFGMEGQVNFSTKGNSYMYRGYILENMAGFDFSSNNLSGEIPSEIGNLSHIRTLNLSHNSFTGFIPPSFSNLRQIESLDLSHNHLTGPIPSQLAQLNALEVFTVAFNNLSGPIPDQKGQFGTFDEVSYQGNPLLCGHAIHINCMKNEPTSTTPTNEDEDVEDDDGCFGMSFYVSFLISYGMTVLVGVVVLIINPYWRQAWFRFIQVFITSCQDLVLDGLLWLQTRSLIN